MPPAISVLLTSTSYPKDLEDWKGVFIRQLLNGLAECQEVTIKYWGPPGDFPVNVDYLCSETESTWLRWVLDQGGVAHILKNTTLIRFVIIIRLVCYLFRTYKNNSKIDIFHINWMQNALPLWKTTNPVLVTVLGSDFALLNIPGMVQFLRMALKRRRCVIAPNAEWMKPELERKFGDIARIIPVPLGINEEWFAIQREVRDESKHTWIVVLRLTNKKIGMLFEWGKDIFQGNPKHELHLFGPMQECLQIPDWVHYHGSTHPLDLCTNWFPQATGLISLSQHDEGRPQIMLEAMASGVPIIASRLPAHIDIIGHKRTGLLVATQEEFTESIEWLVDPTNNRKISGEARRWVKSEIGTWADCAERYIGIYRMLLDGKK